MRILAIVALALCAPIILFSIVALVRLIPPDPVCLKKDYWFRETEYCRRQLGQP